MGEGLQPDGGDRTLEFLGKEKIIVVRSGVFPAGKDALVRESLESRGQRVAGGVLRRELLLIVVVLLEKARKLPVRECLEQRVLAPDLLERAR